MQWHTKRVCNKRTPRKKLLSFNQFNHINEENEKSVHSAKCCNLCLFLSFHIALRCHPRPCLDFIQYVLFMIHAYTNLRLYSLILSFFFFDLLFYLSFLKKKRRFLESFVFRCFFLVLIYRAFHTKNYSYTHL